MRRETDKLYDIMEISPTGPRSWFIDEMVVKRGGISVLTAADPLYVALEMFSLTTSRAVSGVGVCRIFSLLADRL